MRSRKFLRFMPGARVMVAIFRAHFGSALEGVGELTEYSERSV